MFYTLLMAVSYISFGQNKEIETSADIKSVTIYNSSAEINYRKEMVLPQGKSTVIFTDLTPYIVENTINMSTSSADVDIITITEKINYTKEKKEFNSKIINLQDSIKHLENEKGLLKCKVDALTMEKNLLFKDESIGGVAKGVSVAEIEKASMFFSKRYLELTTEIFNLSEKDKAIQNNLAKCNNQIKELSSNTQKAGSEILVTLINATAKNVVFTFKFLTEKGGWAPVYDCKYQGADSPLKFIFRANVFNASGTSWDNIDIKLSTASPTTGFNKPTLNSKKEKDIRPNAGNANGVQFEKIEVANSIAEYDIKHKYTIPSDSKPYLVDVNAYEISAGYNYLLIPVMDPFGFLIAKIPDWNKYNLIPGITNIYNKGSYMGKTFLNTYAENDTLSLYLGKDNNVQSVRKEVSSNNQQNIIGNYYVDKAAITISIKNNSAEKLSIQLLDQIPEFNDNEKAKFNIENIEQAIYNKNEGLLTWNFQLTQNESKVIDYKYDIKVPKNGIGNYIPVRHKIRTINCPRFM